VPDKIANRTKAVLVPLGERLRRVRERLDVQQVQLARTIEMEPTNLAKIERGQKNVTIDTLVRIADGLGLDLTINFKPRRER
jgi:transcriptional regulator with XRE-family HTH domain